jgi:hypothetical protein
MSQMVERYADFILELRARRDSGEKLRLSDKVFLQALDAGRGEYYASLQQMIVSGRQLTRGQVAYVTAIEEGYSQQVAALKQTKADGQALSPDQEEIIREAFRNRAVAVVESIE